MGRGLFCGGRPHAHLFVAATFALPEREEGGRIAFAFVDGAVGGDDLAAALRATASANALMIVIEGQGLFVCHLRFRLKLLFVVGRVAVFVGDHKDRAKDRDRRAQQDQSREIELPRGDAVEVVCS